MRCSVRLNGLHVLGSEHGLQLLLSQLQLGGCLDVRGLVGQGG